MNFWDIIGPFYRAAARVDSPPGGELFGDPAYRRPRPPARGEICLMEKRLSGKTAIITGGASGIGRATGLLFGRHGASVLVADLSQDDAGRAAEEVRAEGGRAEGLSVDVTSSDAVAAAVGAAEERFGGLDILVNSAGLNPRIGSLAGRSEEEVWDAVIEVNLKGTYLACRHAIPAMERRGGGSIINLSSVMGLVGYARGVGSGLSPYNPSKGGVLQLTRNLAVELAPQGHTGELHQPGLCRHPVHREANGRPEGPLGAYRSSPHRPARKTREIAACALFLASDESSFVTGAPLIVDGGYTAQ